MPDLAKMLVSAEELVDPRPVVRVGVLGRLGTLLGDRAEPAG